MKHFPIIMQNTDAFLKRKDTIVALSTPPGIGALGLIRLSGDKAIEVAQSIFSKKITEAKANTAHFGMILGKEKEVIDEVVLTIFHGPHSFTKEDTVEISCHGSSYILQQVLQLLLENGARLAQAGEFTQRAYLNGQMDLAQAEAIADLIASESKAAHQMAMQQMRGGFSNKITVLRENFIGLAALLELELDFAEEDVEFANRDDLKAQVAALSTALLQMINSFALGNALKNGVPVVIIGKPNAGKSTLLNALLEEEKAIVSNIPGTTRDAIEDEKIIQGIRFRFIDTAGLRETEDLIEKIGVARTLSKMQTSQIILYLFDAETENQEDVHQQAIEFKAEYPEARLIVVANKLDLFARFDLFFPEDIQSCAISALDKTGLEELTQMLYESVAQQQISDVIVSNLRHYESLHAALKALHTVEESLELGISTELIASDIREANYHLGTITGEITHEDLLDHIFSKFCIGK